ncbi:MAG: hypothetical protein ACLQU2_07650 [Candidatus Binataceae bacterium]
MSCSSHDTAYFEEQGVPTANVATTEFTEAGRLQYTNLGYPSYDIVFVPHPIFPQTKDEMWTKADEVVEAIVKRLTEQQPGLR